MSQTVTLLGSVTFLAAVSPEQANYGVWVWGVMMLVLVMVTVAFGKWMGGGGKAPQPSQKTAQNPVRKFSAAASTVAKRTESNEQLRAVYAEPHGTAASAATPVCGVELPAGGAMTTNTATDAELSAAIEEVERMLAESVARIESRQQQPFEYLWPLADGQKQPEKTLGAIFRLPGKKNGPDPILENARRHLNAGKSLAASGASQQAAAELSEAKVEAERARDFVDGILAIKRHVERHAGTIASALLKLDKDTQAVLESLPSLAADTSEFQVQLKTIVSQTSTLRRQFSKTQELYDKQYWLPASANIGELLGATLYICRALEKIQSNLAKLPAKQEGSADQVQAAVANPSAEQATNPEAAPIESDIVNAYFDPEEGRMVFGLPAGHPGVMSEQDYCELTRNICKTKLDHDIDQKINAGAHSDEIIMAYLQALDDFASLGSQTSQPAVDWNSARQAAERLYGSIKELEEALDKEQPVKGGGTSHE